jgi:transcription initiation factor TFIIIB Brf1 subunit/transcription initiation factor TFIIB
MPPLMEQASCRRCKSTSIGTGDNGDTVCESCGLVIAEDNIRVEIELSNDGEHSRPIGRVVSASSTGTTVATSVPCGLRYSRRLPRSFLPSHSEVSPVYSHITRIAAVLELNTTLVNQMKSMHDNITTDKEKYCRSSELLAASIAYIILRQNAKPYSLLDLADKVQCDVFALGRVYCRVVQRNKISLEEIDPVLFIDRACSHLASQTELGDSLRMIKMQAVRLVNVAKGDWLVTGRRPSAVAAAAIGLAMESYNLKPNLKVLGESLHIAEPTIRLRAKELKEAMVQFGKSLPWGADITIKNVAAHLPLLLKHLEIMNRPPNQVAPPIDDDGEEPEPEVSSPTTQAQVTEKPFPPAFWQSKIARDRRQAKILRAKRRILAVIQRDKTAMKTLGPVVSVVVQSLSSSASQPDSPDANEDAGDIDHEDLAIERLLLQGVSEDVLLSGYYDAVPNPSQPAVLSDGDDGEGVGEADIPDNEIHKFIRSAEEVRLYRMLHEPDNNDGDDDHGKQSDARTEQSNPPPPKRRRTVRS